MAKNMRGFVYSLVPLILCLCQAYAAQSNCTNLTDPSGNITEYYPGPRSLTYSRCWNIANPNNLLMKIELKHLDFERRSCTWVYLLLTFNRTGERFKWCDNNELRKPLLAYSNVTVYFYVDNGEMTPNSRKNFELFYNIDESIQGIEGVKKALDQSVNWLMRNSTSWKWINHIPKTVTSLSLAGEAAFDGKNAREELMVKQRELSISVALLRDSTSNEQLATFINSILSTCHNPRNFYGRNLIGLLKNQMSSENFTHPSAYLALCNANETWPDKATDDLLRTFKSISGMPFSRDYQAFALMALSCKLHRTGPNSVPDELLNHYKRLRNEFILLQRDNGSFGNFHRTALISQALTSSYELEENTTSWNEVKSIQFLVKSLTFPPKDFLSVYFILPLLNGKSLADIGFKHCPSTRDISDIVDEVADYLGPKIHVQYSVFVEDSKDIIHTVILRVPHYFTAFDVMQIAAQKDEKYKFKYDIVSGKLDIYEMAGIPNDPEDGKFWFFYKKKMDATEEVFTLVSGETGPSGTFLSEGDHIAMWYKKYSVQ